MPTFFLYVLVCGQGFCAGSIPVQEFVPNICVEIERTQRPQTIKKNEQKETKQCEGLVMPWLFVPQEAWPFAFGG
jgi:hypothetical protein